MNLELLKRPNTIVLILGLLVVVFMIGIAASKEKKPAPPLPSRTPPSSEQQNAETERICTDYLASIRYETYEELSKSERQMKDQCELKLELLRELKDAPPDSR